MGRVGEAGEGLTLDDLMGLEAHATSEFFKLVRGLDSRGRWKEAELGEAREKLEKWMGARRRRKKRENETVSGKEINMKTMLCARCGELVPQGCCTCGDRQELVETSSRWPVMMEIMGQALENMLLWHDAVRREAPLVPSPNYIEDCRAAYNAWKSWQ